MCTLVENRGMAGTIFRSARLIGFSSAGSDIWNDLRGLLELDLVLIIRGVVVKRGENIVGIEWSDVQFEDSLLVDCVLAETWLLLLQNTDACLHLTPGQPKEGG